MYANAWEIPGAVVAKIQMNILFNLAFCSVVPVMIWAGGVEGGGKSCLDVGAPETHQPGG